MSKKIAQRVKYWQEDRTLTQIKLTNYLIDSISANNLERIHKSQLLNPPSSQILYLTIPGLPPQQKQFDTYKFPGDNIKYYPPCFDPKFLNRNQIEINKILTQISMKNTVQQINKIVEKYNNQVILVSHSFGSFIASAYCHYYPNKVKGYISIGGPILHFSPVLKDYTKAFLSIPQFNKKMALQVYETIYQLYDNDMKKYPTMNRFLNKYQLLSFVLHNDIDTLNVIFDYNRNLPPILSLSIFGDNDAVFTNNYCRQFAVHNAYLKKNHMSLEYTNSMINIFNDIYENSIERSLKDENGSKTKDSKYTKKSWQELQEKFIFFIKGGHGVHYAQANTTIIQKMINQYLYILLSGNKNYQNNKLKHSKL